MLNRNIFGESHFRVWCQKVLPTIYDDSLSYYELLCKVLKALELVSNEVIAIEDGLSNDTIFLGANCDTNVEEGTLLAIGNKKADTPKNAFSVGCYENGEPWIKIGETKLSETNLNALLNLI